MTDFNKVLFPILNSSSKLVEANGAPSKEFINYLSILHNKLSDILAGDGHRIPVINNKTKVRIEGSDKKLIKKIVHNSDSNTYQVMVNTAGSFKFEDVVTVPVVA